MTPATRCTLAVALGLFAGSAGAEVGGHCTYDGQRVTFVDGAAWPLPADDDAGSGQDDEEGAPPAPEYMLAFVTFQLDAGALARSGDREDALRDQSWEQDESARLELTLQDGVVTQQYLWISPGTNLSYSSGEVGTYTVGKAVANRLAGTYRFTPADGQDLTCSIDFDLPLLGDAANAPPPPGVALPAGGGDPGKAYLAMNAAMRAGDVDALAELMPPAQAAQLAKARNTPDFAAQLALMQAMTPADVRVLGGRQDGDRAWLEFSATEAGQPRRGTAELKRESGRWITVRESTRDPD
ncbi:hypothetical protein [Arenimonas sp. MALMAid1274]|uniref:hypothetical protein n=1 Tax=Arenimonas sp. MALMAid1274 TaxID=3411630 RepID=UPI003BA02B64